jgi:hypothetical protein
VREEDGLFFRVLIQIDTLCHKISKAARAGVKRVFLGLENINPAAWLGKEAADPDFRISRHAAGVEEVRLFHLRWIHSWFPTDTPETIVRDIKIIQRELPIDPFPTAPSTSADVRWRSAGMCASRASSGAWRASG